MRFVSSENPFRLAFWFGQVDSRPIGLFRILFGALLLKDALYHIPLARIFYSDAGVLPRTILLSRPLRPERFSLLDYLGAPETVILFFLLWAVVAICLTVGYQTKLAALANFIIILSVHYRNNYVVNGADNVMRILSFWLLFLPLNQAYSLDRFRRTERVTSSATTFAFPLRIIQLQIAIVYFFSGLAKLRGKVWLQGLGLHYALQLKSFTFPTADWLLSWAPDPLLHVMSVTVLFIELAFPILVFLPLMQPWARLYGLLLGTLLHLGIGATMSIPNFSTVMIISYLLFWKAEWIESIGHWLHRSAGFHRLRQLVPFAPAASGIGEAGQAIAAAPETDNPLPLLSWSGWKRTAQVIVLSALMVSVLWVNLRGVGQPLIPPVNGVAANLLRWPLLTQQWNMFATGGGQSDGWIAVVGRFKDGSVRELRTGQKDPVAMPRYFWGPEARWKKFDEAMRDQPTDHLTAWANYYCREFSTTIRNEPVFKLDSLQFELRIHYSDSPTIARSERKEKVFLGEFTCSP